MKVQKSWREGVGSGVGWLVTDGGRGVRGGLGYGVLGDVNQEFKVLFNVHKCIVQY